MVKSSLVKFRKYPRMVVLRRRNIEIFPEKSVKYIHKSARFAEMMSNIGIERIQAYVHSMTRHSEVLVEMINTGYMNDQIMATEVESITLESENIGSDLVLIGNSLIRFIHTDSERVKGSRLLKTRPEKILASEDDPIEPRLTVPVPADIPKTAFAGCDTHE